MYVEKNGKLIIKKKILFDKAPKLLSHVFDSHTYYLKKIAYDDANYFISKLEILYNTSFENKNIIVSSLMEKGTDKYYPVSTKFTIPATDTIYNSDIKVISMRIPEINKKGLLNVQGKYLACLSELNKAPDFNIDEKGNFQLKMSDQSLNFNKSKKKYIINYKGINKTCTLAEFAIYIACEEECLDKNSDSSEKVKEYIINNYSGIAMQVMAEQIKNTFISTIYTKVSKIIGYYKLTQQRLGIARNAINSCFSLDKIIGQTLAKKVGSFDKETLITPDVLEKLKDLKPEKVYIKYQPDVSGYYLGENIENIEIPAGTKVSLFLLNKLPLLSGYGYTPNKIEVNINLKKGTLITNDINEFLHSLNLDKINICRNKSVTSNVEIPFYKEFISNFNETSELLTYTDIKALLSYIAGTIEMPDVFNVFHRDSNFFKNAYTFCETLSNTYRRNVNRYISRINAVEVKSAVTRAVQGKNSELQNLMNKIIQKTFTDLYMNAFYREPDFKNPAALLSHNRKLVSMVDSNGATITMRTVMMGHYGRICPYDTPSSGKIGLTNSLAVRAKIRNGIIYTPYHPIIKRNENYFVSKKIYYLSPKDEFQYKIGDIISLEHIEDGKDVFSSPIANTIVKARVPSLNESEILTIESICAWELDYVNVYEDQLLSHCAALIPFLGSDDGARITFACSMFRQAEAILYSEKPYVYTGMYKWLIDDTDYIVRAEYDGIIQSISPNSIKVLYDNQISPTEIQLKRQMMTTGNIVVMESHKTENDEIKKEELIADSLISKDGMFTPGVNFLIAFLPYYGYNNEDGIVISKKAAYKLTSFTYNNVSISLGDNANNEWKFNSYVKIGQYVGEDTNILGITSKNQNIRPKFLKTRVGKTGIVQKISKTYNKSEDKVTFKADIISIDELIEGDKLSGRHGNKGVISLIENISSIPSFLNGELIDIVLNPCGLPSRMNLGQQLEAHLSFVCYLLDIHIRSDSFNGASVNEIMELMQFCYDIANTDFIDDIINLSKYSHLPKIIKSQALKRFSYLQKWKGCFYPDGTAILINNRNGKPFANKVVVGNMYFMKLAHEVEHKRGERGGILENATYSAVSKQPMHGLKKHGGQAIGEMEMWAVLAHGANNLFLEMLHGKSDNIYIRNAMRKAVKEESVYEECFDPTVQSNHATEALHYFIEGMNGFLETNIGTNLSLNSIKNQLYISDQDLADINLLQKYNQKDDGDIDEYDSSET